MIVVARFGFFQERTFNEMNRPQFRLALRAIFTVAIALAFFTAGSFAMAQDVVPLDELPPSGASPSQEQIIPSQIEIAPVQPEVEPSQRDFSPAPNDQAPDHFDTGATQSQSDYLSADNLPPPDEATGNENDPLMPLNEKMFTFNLKMDEWFLRPVASGYAAVAPKPVRESVARFFENTEVVKHFSNNLFQLRFKEAGEVAARFGINTTLGLAGFFDPADSWFGLKEHKDDFGLTLRYYGAPTGPYLMLPLFGPSTVADTIGIAVDHVMNPLDYILGWPIYIEIPVSIAKRGIELVNYRSLRMDQFEAADRYAVDLYGAVQDAYLQKRAHELSELGRTGSESESADGEFSSDTGSMYALIAAPSTIDFPYGNWDTLRNEWSEVSTFPNRAACRDALDHRGSMGEEHPLDCVATDTKEYSQLLSNAGR